jgi:diguanylate cyclase (GGDEF)-like protein
VAPVGGDVSHHAIEPPSPDFEARLIAIAATIQEFAQLHFGVRAPVGPDGDIVDAVAAGVNFLGDELEVSYREIEQRVADRTVELELVTDEMRQRALHDQLTGLPNRTLFWDRLTHRLRQGPRRSESYAVLFIDLDGFKVVNDSWGHATGDQLLIDVAKRISSELRTGDSAARIGGDEFLVLLDQVASAFAALDIAKRLGEVLHTPFDVGPSSHTITAAIGIAMASPSLRSADELVSAADTAMYAAKRDGPGRCHLYDHTAHRHDAT